MIRVIPLLLIGWALMCQGSVAADDEAQVRAVLEREILAPKQTEQEIRAYCRSRVLPMPAMPSAAAWQATAAQLRAAVLEKIIYRGQAVHWRDAPLRTDWQKTIPGGPGYHIRKLRYEALPGLWIPAVLYEPEPERPGQVPGVLNVNGHEPKGNAVPYKQIRAINQAKRGMLALNVDWLYMGQLREDGLMHWRMNQIDLCGSSGVAVFYLAMKRGLDVLLSLPRTDPARVAVTGVSGGGWQTIFISGLDTRVTLCNPVAGYSSLLNRADNGRDLGDSEQTPNDLGTLLDYTHLTAMVAPRPLLLTYNAEDDCCFWARTALPPLLKAAQPIYQLFHKPQALRSHINKVPGTHNYEQDNREACYRMLGDFFFAGSKDYSSKEIPCDKEIKSPQELKVAMPEKNEDFNSLALKLAKSLPREPELPREKKAALRWQQQRRVQLRSLIRASDYALHAVAAGSETYGSRKATYWRLSIGKVWTVPAVEAVEGQPKGTVPLCAPTQTAILLADAGRRTAVVGALRLLNSDYRVIAIDPLGFGEAPTTSDGHPFAILISCVGGRLLGIQASQLAAVARWAAAGQGPVTVVSYGPRSSVVALAAAALEEKAIGRVELNGSLASLKEVIEQNRCLPECPELFCFGLLESFDIRQMAALIAPRPVTLIAATPRMKAELKDLAAWYQLFGSRHQPLR